MLMPKLSGRGVLPECHLKSLLVSIMTDRLSLLIGLSTQSADAMLYVKVEMAN
jgi:hypothetical protein